MLVDLSLIGDYNLFRACYYNDCLNDINDANLTLYP